MQIEFKRVKAENFLSFGSFELGLNNRGFCSIVGTNLNVSDNAKSNGSGKSSLIESIMWCLTGQTVRGVKDVVNINTEGGALVELEFSVDGTDYKLIRTKDHSKYKTTLLLYVNDTDVSGKGIRDTEKLLSEYLPDLTFEFISSVIILGQGLPQRFSDNTPSGRKEVLEKLSKSDFMIQDLKDKLTKRTNEFNSEKRSVEDRLIKNQTLYSSYEKIIADTQLKIDNYGSIDDIQLEINNHNSMIEDLKESIKTVSHDIKGIDEEINGLRLQYDGLMNSQTLEEDTVNKKYAPIISELTNTKLTLNSECLTLRNEINRIKKMTDVCPTCKQKIKGIIIPDTSEQEAKLVEVEFKLNSVQNELKLNTDNQNNELSEIRSRFNDNSSQLKNKINELSSDKREAETMYNSFQQELMHFTNELNKYVTQMQVFNAQLDNLKATVTNTSIDKDNVESNINQCKLELTELDEHEAVLKKFATLLSRDFRGYLLTNIITYIDSRAKTYCQDIFDNDLIKITLEGNNINIYFDKKEYSALSGGEKQKIDLILQLSLRDMLMSFMGFSCNILCLDELFDNCDSVGCDKVINLLTRKLNDLKSIFIITHHGDELSIPYDTQINVVKNINGISEVQI